MDRLSRLPPALLVMLLAAVLVLAFQGSRAIWDPSEGRFVNVSLQMLASGDIISLYRHPDHLHFTKPPVTYWAMAASMAVFGLNEWAVRLPNALAWLGVVALLLRIGRHFSPRKPWLAGLVYATLPLPLLAAHLVGTDSLLTFATTLAFACYVIARFENRPLFVLGMWAAFGLAFLTKGPPGLLGLAGILALHLLHRGGPRLFPPLGLALFAVVGLSWFVVVSLRHEGLFAHFLGYEVVARVLTDTHGRNAQWWGGFYVYGLSLLIGTLPWWPWALAAARRSGLRWREAAPETRLLLLWLGIGLVVFMVAQSRRPLYILPLFTPLALLFARALQDSSFSPLRKLMLGLAAAFVIGVKLLTANVVEVARLLPADLAERSPADKDDRQWSADLRAVLPFEPAELIFVNDSVRYGPALYFGLGLTIETVVFEGDPAPQPISDAPYDNELGEELREQDHARSVFVMRPWAAERFAAEAAAAGWRAERLGPVQDRVAYRLLPARAGASVNTPVAPASESRSSKD